MLARPGRGQLSPAAHSWEGIPVTHVVWACVGVGHEVATTTTEKVMVAMDVHAAAVQEWPRMAQR